MAEESARFRDWDRRQWASVPRDRDGVGTTEARANGPGATARWNKGQWVGENRLGRRPSLMTPGEMPEGEPGISGNRHVPGVQDWASGSSRRAAALSAWERTGSTRSGAHLLTGLVPWDDGEFVRAYERAQEQVVGEGLVIHGPKAGARLEALMRAAGYTRVSVTVDRTIDEALDHAARWTVRRDG